MKISLALLILLLAAAWTGSQGYSFRRSEIKCCAKGDFHHQPILASNIKDYRYTCNHKGVLVQLRREDQGWICVDPQNKRFQKYLKKQKKSNSAST